MTPIIHQALHGYSDGHRLISSSLSLSSADARIMIVMSDLSGPGVKPEPSGYLTGYPLGESGKYVLARTWAAPEMPRPGCVWTHSLLIDNADLAILTSADNLFSAFRRPVNSSIKPNYSEPLPLPVVQPRPLSMPKKRVWEVMNALYSAPEQPILAEVEKASEDEHLVAAIWMQQWPRLRRTFSFCTLSGMDRSQKGVRLDLQLVRSLDRQARAQFPGAVIVSEAVEETALEPLMADIESSNSQVREFLRKTGGDVDGGRRAMVPLCRLYTSLFTNAHPDISTAVNALVKLNSFGTQQARSVRALIAWKAIEEIESLDDAVFDFVVDSLELGTPPNKTPIAAERVGKALWRRSPIRFVNAIDAGGFLGQASASALSTIETSELVDGLRTNAQLAERIVYARPDLLECADFWSIPDVDEALVALAETADIRRVATALLKAGRYGSAPWFAARADSSQLALSLNDSSTEPALYGWLFALINLPEKAAEVLASGLISHRSIAVAIARNSEPDTVPNNSGEDPWFIVLRSAVEPMEQADEDYLAAYLMSRALGFRSRSQAELFRFSYTTLYRALQQSRLPRDVENLFKWRLDWGSWFVWDNCSRLRETVVKNFIERQLDPKIFGHLTNDAKLAVEIIDEAARTGRGRRYLGKVRKQLKDTKEKGFREMADYIASKIK